MSNSAYLDGRKAYYDGKKRNDNPHHMSSSAHELWHEGYEDAEKEDADCQDPR